MNLLYKDSEIYVSDFYISETEVTQKLFKEVMGYNPSSDISPDKPVEAFLFMMLSDSAINTVFVKDELHVIPFLVKPILISGKL